MERSKHTQPGLEFYYWCEKTGEATWERPKLPVKRKAGDAPPPPPPVPTAALSVGQASQKVLSPTQPSPERAHYASLGRTLTPVSQLLRWRPEALRELKNMQDAQRDAINDSPGLPKPWRKPASKKRGKGDSASCEKPNELATGPVFNLPVATIVYPTMYVACT